MILRNHKTSHHNPLRGHPVILMWKGLTQPSRALCTETVLGYAFLTRRAFSFSLQDVMTLNLVLGFSAPWHTHNLMLTGETNTPDSEIRVEGN